MTAPNIAVSIDVGGTLTKAAIVDGRGKIRAEDVQPTATDIAPTRVPAHVAGIVRELLRRAGVSPGEVSGLCIGVPGIVDYRTGDVLSCPNLTNWEGMPLGRLVEEEIGLPTYLDKDANLAAMGEYWQGASRGVRHSICFTLGTGIGTGIILDGRLYRGAIGGAGEIGHITLVREGPLCGCGNRGCLEALASASAIVREARTAVARDPSSKILTLAHGDPATITAEVVFSAAQEGDITARTVVMTALEYLGIGVASMVNALNPDMVVLAGGMAAAGEIIGDVVRHVVRQRVRLPLAAHVRVVIGSLGGYAGVLGGAYLVFQGLQEPVA